MGHSIVQNHVSFAAFDGMLTGEFSVLHSGLLADPMTSASYTGINSAGVHLMAGNVPDRVLFSSQRAAGFAAGLGYGNHPFMEPGKKFADCCAFIQPLWDLLRAMPKPPVRVHNPAVGTSAVTRSSHEALHPVVYQASDKSALVIVTNLSDKPVSGSVDVDLAALGLKAGAVIKTLPVKGCHVAQIQGGRIIVNNLQPYYFCGQIVSRR